MSRARTIEQVRSGPPIFSVILMLVGALAVIIAAGVFHQALQNGAWVRVDATVVNVSHTTETIRNSVGGVSLVDLYAPTFQFVVADQQQTFVGDCTSTHYMVGQVVGVFIKPGDQSTVLLQPPPQHLTLALILGGLGLISIGLGGWFLGRRRDSRDAPPV